MSTLDLTSGNGQDHPTSWEPAGAAKVAGRSPMTPTYSDQTKEFLHRQIMNYIKDINLQICKFYQCVGSVGGGGGEGVMVHRGHRN